MTKPGKYLPEQESKVQIVVWLMDCARFTFVVVAFCTMMLLLLGGAGVLYQMSKEAGVRESERRDRINGLLLDQQRIIASDWGTPALDEMLSHTRTNATCDDKGFVLPNAIPTVSTFRCVNLGEYRVIPADPADEESHTLVFASRGENISMPMLADTTSTKPNHSREWDEVSRRLSEYLNR